MKSLTKSGWRCKSTMAQAHVCAALLAGLAFANLSSGANILLNTGFEGSGGAWPPVAPSDWTYFGPGGNFYINTDTYAHSGNNYFKIWGTEWNTGAAGTTGVYQDRPSLATSVYQADAWFFTGAPNTGGFDTMGPDNRCWLEVSFRDAGGNILALYKSDLFGAAYGTLAWFDLAVTNVCDINPASGYAVTGSVSQLVAPVGTTFVRAQVSNYQINNGGGSCYVDDLKVNQLSGPVPPVIGNLVPGNMLLASAANGISFNASSPSGTAIDSSDIHLTVNGADATASLSVSGTASSKDVSYHGLISNQFYTATISLVDSLGLSGSATLYFDTLAPIYVWEAEDFDFTNGTFLDNPVLANTAGDPNSYFGKVGTQGVDENENAGGAGDHLYRADDPMATTLANDSLRQKFVDAQMLDYKLGWFDGNEWVNYTHTYPAGLYNIYARLAGGQGAASVTFSTVTPSKTTDLGTFAFIGTNWNAFYYVPLTDTNGNLAAVPLGGVQTVRLTTAGGADMNFFMLVAAQTNLPTLGNFYPTGAHPFEPTNTFGFTVTSPVSTIDPTGIQVSLNGLDVSPSLVIGGTASSRAVSFPHLALNVIYTAIIKVKDGNGLSVAHTNHFDTFSQNNFMVEAEDFDYDGGQFFDSLTPNVYAILSGVENVDYLHTPASGEQLTYRFSLPTQPASDFLRQKYVDAGMVDYNLGWFNNGDWGNYTRTYPAGKFLVFGRFAGSGGYSMYLDQVMRGTGTVNQVTQRLGRWGAVGRDWQAYDWVPLTDEGLASPVVVTLGGVTTLRVVTTGNCNPNFFMLVPISGIGVTAAPAGNNILVSFPTQLGIDYRVFYRSDLTAGNWTLLATVPGTGSLQSVSDPVTTGQRFYRVVSP